MLSGFLCNCDSGLSRQITHRPLDWLPCDWQGPEKKAVLPQTSASDCPNMPAVRLMACGCGLLGLQPTSVHPLPPSEDEWLYRGLTWLIHQSELTALRLNLIACELVNMSWEYMPVRPSKPSFLAGSTYQMRNNNAINKWERHCLMF